LARPEVDDHVVRDGGFAAKVDGDRFFFRLHIVKTGEDQVQGLVSGQAAFSRPLWALLWVSILTSPKQF